MEEWKEYKLGDVCDFQEGYVNPPQGNPEYFDGDIKWLRATDLNDGFVYSTTRTLTHLGFKSARKSAILFKPGTIAISKSGTIGRLGILQDYMCGNRAVINIIPHHTVNTYFVFCVLRSYQRYFPSMAVGSVQKNLYISILEDLKINLPDLETQKRIVSVLKSLDDKIEVNRRINDNLEQQAQALFKSWFVDFEPFKDDEFVESELGMIPKGWRVGTIDDICCFESGFAFKSATYKQEGEYKLITIKNVQDGYLDVNGLVSINEVPGKLPQYCFLNIGDILLSLTGNVGRCCFVDEENLLLNQRVAKLKPRVGSNWGYIYTLFRNCAFKERVISIARGTAQANLSPVETSKLKIIVPSENTLEKFSQIINGYYHIMIINMIESRRLASLRDTLLPKLMSGELKVFDKPNDQS